MLKFLLVVIVGAFACNALLMSLLPHRAAPVEAQVAPQARPVSHPAPAAPEPAKAEPKAPVDPLAGREGSVCVLAQRYVAGKLKTPSSADFPSCLLNANQAHYWGHGLYKVNSYVDSQNGFGAMIRTRYSCELTISREPNGKIAATFGAFETY